MTPVETLDRALPEFGLTAKTLEAQTSESLAKAKARLDALAALPAGERTFENTAMEFDRAQDDLGTESTAHAFLQHVSPDEDIRNASRGCEASLDKFLIDVWSREDLYAAVSGFAAASRGLKGEDAKLLKKTLDAFRRSGMALPPIERARLKVLKGQLVELELAYRTRLGEIKDYLSVTEAELAGCPPDYVGRLKRDGARYRVTMDGPDYLGFMQNAEDASARARLEKLYHSRGGPDNVAIFEEALRVRGRIAETLGCKSYSHFVLEERMAKDPRAALAFLGKLRAKLRPGGLRERAELLALKRRDHPGARALETSDYFYYFNKLKKERFHIDEESTKAYFPLEGVLSGMLELFGKVLGVRFTEVRPARAWHADVRLFRVADSKSGSEIGHFYLDLHPRDGKYKHMAVFGLVCGRREDGGYRKPVCAMVGNFNPPSKDRPSLLKHSEVATLFHEFGHVVHQVLTQAKHPRFSGTQVLRDFVEAPSQLMENWVWQEEVMERLSGHYEDRSRKLPKETLKAMIAARQLGSGLRNLRQILYGTADLAYHSGPCKDTTAAWRAIHDRVTLFKLPEGVLPQASFGHLMGGYESSYYGYLWAEVFSADMFTRFQREGLFNAKTGADYRRLILEPGGGLDEAGQVRAFLGRAPNEAAFLETLGVAPKRG
ncbi:MAG: Zn-dependent oligopeptidase [Elusimicrobia bacterium]|nr:Zn-dependent oligopeptidase [Elusimicrobiota bacterium]